MAVLKFGPEDKGYSDNISLFNGMISKNPDLVFVCSSQDQIVEAVNYARSISKTVSVLGSGHNVSGRALMGQIVISIRAMRKIEVQIDKSMAICESGVTMSILDNNTYRNGLVCPGGTVSSTGISGLTLGGGIGWLHGNLGTSSDNVSEIEIIDCWGDKLICNDSNHSDLFWLLRGAGFGVGAVSKITYNLSKILVFAGYNCILDFAMFDLVKRKYTSITMTCSKNLTCFISILTNQENKKIISIEIAFSNFENNNLNEFEVTIQEIRDIFSKEIIKEEFFDNYVVFQSHFDNEKKFGMRSYWKSLIKDDISERDWDFIKSYSVSAPSKYTTIFIERYHGRMCEMPSKASAFGKRKKGYGILITSTWVSEKDDIININWTKKFHDDLSNTNSSKYINYLSDPYLSPGDLYSTYGKSKVKKILQIQKHYDPIGLFVKPTK